MKVVRDNWAILELKRVTLDVIRNQLSGHVQFKLEPVELTVENTDWKTPEFFVRKKTEIFEFAYRPQFVDVWTLLIEIAPLLSNSIAHLVPKTSTKKAKIANKTNSQAERDFRC
jgi:hypothetical protein